MIAEGGLECDFREWRIGLHKIKKSHQRLDQETPNGDRSAAGSGWSLRRGCHGGVTGAGVVVLQGGVLSAIAPVARLASACRNPCTPGWSWRSLLSPLLIVTAKGIAFRGRS